MKLRIKSMVCNRCKIAVKNELERLSIYQSKVEIGEVEINEPISDDKMIVFSMALKKMGLEIIDDRKDMLIERIKGIVIRMIHYSDYYVQTNFSDLLSNAMSYNYNYLANIFSEKEGITIEHFIILQKIEKVKEMLGNSELNLTEIAEKLNYSSVAHLSYQFKKTTGLTPTHFKTLKLKKRIVLENI
ncbi:MAG: AraC family transcriptional regulator [Bacteroidota bacterium]|nr:AraC family transcriptional regulator [Bacteroidota bacterium]